MFHPIKIFVAVLLAIWLPLFSGSALAASIAMQITNDDCHPAVAQQNEHHAHQVSIAHHRTTLLKDQIAASQDQVAGQHDQQNSSCKDCSVCHFACSGYMVTVTIDALETLISSQKYHASPVLFQSYSSAPLDPPPLSRV